MIDRGIPAGAGCCGQEETDTRVWREEGLKQGLAAERRMLLRQIALRFDAATAQAAEPGLARIEHPEAFEPIAEWVIDARDAEDFLSRLRTPAP
jgi:hypothetical protein